MTPDQQVIQRVLSDLTTLERRMAQLRAALDGASLLPREIALLSTISEDALSICIAASYLGFHIADRANAQRQNAWHIAPSALEAVSR